MGAIRLPVFEPYSVTTGIKTVALVGDRHVNQRNGRQNRSTQTATHKSHPMEEQPCQQTST